MNRFARFLGHEIRPLAPPRVCACGMSPVDTSGRCLACADRADDRLAEFHRGELDEDRLFGGSE